MKKQTFSLSRTAQLSIAIASLLFSSLTLTSCSKNDDTGEPTTEFRITDIQTVSDKLIVGQQVTVKAEFSEAGNTLFEWSVKSGGTIIKSETSTSATFSFHVTQAGNYDVELIATRGTSDRSQFKKTLTFDKGDFEFGAWGDSKEAVLEAESINGNERFGALVRIPEVIPDNEGLTHVMYERGNERYTYYFKDEKLVAGASVYIYPTAADARPAYSHYGLGKLAIESHLGISLPEEHIWTIGDEAQKAHYLTDANTISEGIRLGYLSIKSEGNSSRGFGRLHIFRASTGINSEYVIASNLL